MMGGGGNTQGGTSITPTLFQGKQINTITPKIGKTINPALSKQLSSEELQKKLPIVAPDFTLDYSPRMQKYVASIQSEDARVSYEEWLAQNPPYQQELQMQNVIISQQSLKELDEVLDAEAKDPMTPEKKAIRDTKALNDIITNVINLPEELMKIQSNEEITPIVPTPTIVIPTPTSSPLVINLPLNNLLPNPLTPLSPKALSFKNSIATCLTNRSTYDTASTQTGMPWEILAAIHYIEGGCGANKSLVSGRTIGVNEPDLATSGGCTGTIVGPGVPIPLPGGGCGFSSLLDTAIYAALHLKGKVGGKNPSNFQELAMAFSRYNGGWYEGQGNSNCGKTPYVSCPRLFFGEDNAYVMNMFDERHETMYLVYCADNTLCSPPRLFSRPGTATVIRLLTNQL